ncbi:Ger(x)C family spore germination protein [Bacillus sp. 3255]|uniref:Ger(x)C family spore germination protein n=1 Tax=Bacillus sp. 3255 TaxID=2817904 RepID=UPI0028673156|nr:Ger(x)C family spore germination protein [Bacillus sp. 3255]MDR6879248.1 spore germination protein KC [Bacillus sp. 3255]
MKLAKPCAILLGVSIMLVLAGCWNSRELNDMAVVVGMGIDRDPATKEYHLSFQTIIPNAVAAGVKGGGMNLPIVIHSASDATLFGALRKTSQKVPRKLFFAHIQQIVIGETLAREGIEDLFDFLERSHELRLTSHVLIARGSDAEAVMRIMTPMEKNPAEGNAKRLELTSNIWAENINSKVTDVLHALIGKGEVAISGVHFIGDKRTGETKGNMEKTKLPAYIEMKGIAIFKDKKLKKWVEGDEARGILWIQNHMNGTVINLSCKGMQDGTSVELVRSKTKVQARVEKGTVSFQIDIDEEGTIGEVHCPIDLSKRKEVLQIQQQWAAETEKVVKETVKIAQELQADVFGFGDQVYRNFPEQWAQMEGKWPEIFANSQIDVHVNAYIRRSGMRNKPYFFKH